jgi:two-component system chemotaxis sensor kinase CheA
VDREAFARRLLQTFASEVEEQSRVLSEEVLALEQQPDDAARFKSVFRVAHSLKGAARAAGVPLVEQVFHALESTLDEVRRGERELADADFAKLLAAVDAMEASVPLLRSGADLATSPLPDLLLAVTGRKPLEPRPSSARPAPPVAAVPLHAAAPTERRREESVRVDAPKLDLLLAAADELLLERARIVSRGEEIAGLADDCQALSGRWHKFGRMLRLAVDRGALGRQGKEAFHALDADVERLARSTRRAASAARREAAGLEVAVERVADRTRDIRMRPFRDAIEPLGRAARDVAKVSGKEVRLEFDGLDIELDRAVLDGLRDAMLQLVRNAVDHGIEPAAERTRRGKPPTGMIRVGAALAGDRIAVTVSDDGMGLDIPRLREVLTSRRIEAPADDAGIAELLLAGGVSTREEATAISGRGVGLDVVRDAVKRIRGTVRIDSSPGVGTTIAIECAPTLTTIRAVLLRIGSHLLAIPTTHVVRLLRERVAALVHSQGGTMVAVGDEPVPLVPLARVLGPAYDEAPVGDHVLAAIVDDGTRRLGFVVDEFVAEQEIVLRPLDHESVDARFVSGAANLGTGRIAVVLNVPAVAAAAAERVALPIGTRPPSNAARRSRILVVDDSLTTRTLEASVLQAAGFEVATAVDGADAWRIVQAHGCDLVVSDIDMPRMDGIELCRAIRSSPRFASLPVVLISALESGADRQRGSEAGADAYIGKSAFDQEQLVDIVRQLIG